jgi:hypothetical protein
VWSEATCGIARWRSVANEVKRGWCAGGGEHVPSLHSVARCSPMIPFNVMKAVGREIYSLVTCCA